jgi:hypothetical protein
MINRIEFFFAVTDNQWAIDTVRVIINTKQSIIDRLNVMQNKVVPSYFERNFFTYIQFLVDTDTIINECMGTSLAKALKIAKDFDKFDKHMLRFAKTECPGNTFLSRLQKLYNTQDVKKLVEYHVSFLFVTRS